jgi:superkiller protein 3
VTGALELLKKELATHPDEIALHREYQDTMRAAGQVAALRGEYEARQKAQPDSALSHYLYGRSIILESPREAEAAFKKALDLDPKFLWAYLGLGTVHSMAGDNFAAVQTYESALKYYPDSADVYFNLADALHEIGALPKALEAAERAIKLRPDFAAAYVIIGRSQLEQQDMTSARTSLEKALSLNPDLAKAHVAMAQLEAKKGDLEAAKRHGSRAVQLGEPLPDALKTQLGLP